MFSSRALVPGSWQTGARMACRELVRATGLELYIVLLEEDVNVLFGDAYGNGQIPVRYWEPGARYISLRDNAARAVEHFKRFVVQTELEPATWSLVRFRFSQEGVCHFMTKIMGRQDSYMARLCKLAAGDSYEEDPGIWRFYCPLNVDVRAHGYPLALVMAERVPYPESDAV